jgi:hypothetical protein
MAAEEPADDDKPEQEKSDKDPETREPAGKQVRFSEWINFIFRQSVAFDNPLILQRSFIS